MPQKQPENGTFMPENVWFRGVKHGLFDRKTNAFGMQKHWFRSIL